MSFFKNPQLKTAAFRPEAHPEIARQDMRIVEGGRVGRTVRARCHEKLYFGNRVRGRDRRSGPGAKVAAIHALTNGN